MWLFEASNINARVDLEFHMYHVCMFLRDQFIIFHAVKFTYWKTAYIKSFSEFLEISYIGCIKYQPFWSISLLLVERRANRTIVIRDSTYVLHEFDELIKIGELTETYLQSNGE